MQAIYPGLMVQGYSATRSFLTVRRQLGILILRSDVYRGASFVPCLTLVCVLLSQDRKGMASFQSSRVYEYLDRAVRSLPPEAKLPTDKELAQLLDVSMSTVRRCINDPRYAGKLLRLQGSGTKIGAAPETPAPQSTPSPAQGIADAIVRLISNGELRRGDMVPAYKQLCNEFRVCASTVKAALNIVEKKGLIAKLGRTWRVGTVHALLRSTPKREIGFVYSSTLDLSKLFTDAKIGTVLQKCENELFHCGYLFRYSPLEGRKSELYQWIDKKNPVQSLLLLGSADGRLMYDEFTALLPALTRYLRNYPYTRVLTPTKDILEKHSRIYPFSFGHYRTKVVRELVQSCVGRKLEQVVICCNCRTEPLDVLARGFRLHRELEQMNRHTPKLYALHAGTKSDFLRAVQARWSIEHVNAMASKRSGMPFRSVDELVEPVDPLERIMAGVSPPLLVVCSRDADAVQLLDYCAMRQLRVPRDVGIVGLENDPAFLSRGLTTCVPDWDAVGYLWAHTLIGDIPIERSSKGFVNARAALYRRRTF